MRPVTTKQETTFSFELQFIHVAITQVLAQHPLVGNIGPAKQCVAIIEYSRLPRRDRLGFCQEFVARQGEEASSSNWFFYSLSQGQAVGPNGMSMADYLWSVQYRIIRELAEKEPCVIVGRCGDYVLEDRDDCLHVFVHAPMEFKKERILRLYGERKEKPEKRLEEKDKKRKLYYQHYTGRDWGMAKNYHLCLDSSLIGVENCVDIIERLAKGL